MLYILFRFEYFLGIEKFLITVSKLKIRVTDMTRTLSIIFGITLIFGCSSGGGDSGDSEQKEVSVSCQIACEGLVGHYTFDDDVLDRSGFGNHGIRTNNVESVSDSKGNSKSAYQFNGTDSVIEIKNPITGTDQDFTLMVYTKISKYEHRTDLDCPLGGGNRAGLIDGKTSKANLSLMYCPSWFTQNGYPQYKYQVWYQNFQSSCDQNCVMEDSYFKSDLNIDEYYLFSVTWDSQSNQTRLYQNTNLLNSANWREYPSGDLLIGGLTNENSYPLNGVIDEVRIYNRSLSNSEISEIFQSFQ